MKKVLLFNVGSSRGVYKKIYGKNEIALELTL
jgi:hypothetical protein